MVTLPVVQPSQSRLKQILVAASLSWLCTLTQTISYTKNKKCYVAFCVLWIPYLGFNVLVNICVHLRLGHRHAMYINMRERAHHHHFKLSGHMNWIYTHQLSLSVSNACLHPVLGNWDTSSMKKEIWCSLWNWKSEKRTSIPSIFRLSAVGRKGITFSVVSITPNFLKWMKGLNTILPPNVLTMGTASSGNLATSAIAINSNIG